MPVLIPAGGASRCLTLAHECSRRFRVWTPSREWSPLDPNPARKDGSTNLLETVEDTGTRPEGEYAITPATNKNGKPVTLLEQMVLESERLKSADPEQEAKKWIICAGSRCYVRPEGFYLPIVRWWRGALTIHFTPPNKALADSRKIYVTW